MFSVHTRLEEFKKGKSTCLWTCVWENCGRVNHINIVSQSFPKDPFSKRSRPRKRKAIHSVARTCFQSSPGCLIVSVIVVTHPRSASMTHCHSERNKRARLRNIIGFSRMTALEWWHLGAISPSLFSRGLRCPLCRGEREEYERQASKLYKWKSNSQTPSPDFVQRKQKEPGIWLWERTEQRNVLR